MNSIKQGVKLYGIKPEMSAVDSVVTSVFAKHGIDCVITSGVRPADGKSLHGAGFAYDYRANHIDDIECVTGYSVNWKNHYLSVTFCFMVKGIISIFTSNMTRKTTHYSRLIKHFISNMAHGQTDRIQYE